MATDDFFTTTLLLESYAKISKVDNISKKLLYIAIRIKAKEAVKSFSVYLNDQILGSALRNIMISAGYLDNPTETQLENLTTQTYVDFLNIITDNGNYITIPYSEVSNPDRIYRFILDVTQVPTYQNLWSRSPMVFYADKEGLTGEERPKVSILMDIADCDELIKNLEDMIDGLTGDGSMNADDIYQLKEILNGTADNCVKATFTKQDWDLPTYAEDSLLADISNIDKLICYLKSQILKYKTEITISSGTSNCYKFVPCLIKGYIGLNKLFRQAQSAYNTLYVNSMNLRCNYVALVDEYQRCISAVNGIKNSVNTWIINNLDEKFDLSKITCSNTVEVKNGEAITFHDKFSGYWNSNGKFPRNCV